MQYQNQYKEALTLCTAVQNDKDANGWNTLHEFDNITNNKSFNSKVFKKGNIIVIAFAGADIKDKNDLMNAKTVLFTNNRIPSQYGNAERLYVIVKNRYPNENIKFTGYSFGATVANLLSHRTGLSSTAIAPIGSKHIVEANKAYFKYGDENILTFGRKGDIFFDANIKRQSGNIVILPDLNNNEKGHDLSIVENHYLHNYKFEQIFKAKLYQNTIKPAINTDKGHIYTREEIGKMSREEFEKNEKAIMKQVKEKGIPTNSELQKFKQKSNSSNTNSSASGGGHWVTINGNHVLINK